MQTALDISGRRQSHRTIRGVRRRTHHRPRPGDRESCPHRDDWPTGSFCPGQYEHRRPPAPGRSSDAPRRRAMGSAGWRVTRWASRRRKGIRTDFTRAPAGVCCVLVPGIARAGRSKDAAARDPADRTAFRRARCVQRLDPRLRRRRRGKERLRRFTSTRAQQFVFRKHGMTVSLDSAVQFRDELIKKTFAPQRVEATYSSR